MKTQIFLLCYVLLQVNLSAAVWPLSNSSASNADVITSGFGPRNNGGLYQLHWGLDISSGNQTVNVHSIKAGTVYDKGTSGSAGNWIAIEHTDESVCYYYHLESLPSLAIGATVSQGAIIGQTGNSGAGFNKHLHVVYYPDVNYLGDFTADQHLYSYNPMWILPHETASDYTMTYFRSPAGVPPYLKVEVRVPPKRMDLNEIILNITNTIDVSNTSKNADDLVAESDEVEVTVPFLSGNVTYTYSQYLSTVNFDDKNNIDFGVRVGNANQASFNGVEIIPAEYTNSNQATPHLYTIVFYLSTSALEQVLGNIGRRYYDITNCDGDYSPEYDDGWVSVFYLQKWPHTVTSVTTDYPLTTGDNDRILINEGGKVQIQNGGIFAAGAEPTLYPKLQTLSRIQVESGGTLDLLPGPDTDHRTWFSNYGTVILDAGATLSMWSHTVFRNCGTFTDNGTIDYHGGTNGELFFDCTGIATIGANLNVNASGACILAKSNGQVVVAPGKTITFSNGGFLVVRSGGSLVVDDGGIINITSTASNTLFDPGVAMKFGNNSKFISGRPLSIVGTSSSRITFTSQEVSPNDGDWGGIELTSGPNTLQYVNVDYAVTGVKVLTASGTTIQNTRITNSSQAGVHGINATGYGSLKLIGTEISNNSMHGLLGDNSWISISSNSLIEDNSGDGVRISTGTQLRMDHSTIQSNSGYGINVSGTSTSAYLAEDLIWGGYNLISGNTAGQIYKSSGTVFLGTKWQGCDCLEIHSEEIKIINTGGECGLGCTLEWLEEGGYNEVDGNGYWIYNGSSSLVKAALTQWGECPPPAGNFYGNVDVSSPLECFEEQVTRPNTGPEHDYGYVHPDYIVKSGDLTMGGSRGTPVKLKRWINHLKYLVQSDTSNTGYAIPMLASFAEMLPSFPQLLGDSWSDYLASVDQSSLSGRVKEQSRIFQIRNNVRNNELNEASEKIVSLLGSFELDKETWLACQTQRVLIALMIGDTSAALNIFNLASDQGSEIDRLVIESLARILEGHSMGATTPNIVIKNNVIMDHPYQYTLAQNYPNPFNPGTTIAYSLPENTHVILRVYDVLGRSITTLVSEYQEPGFKTVTFDANAYPTGIYYYQLQAGSYSNIKTMILVK